MQARQIKVDKAEKAESKAAAAAETAAAGAVEKAVEAQEEEEEGEEDSSPFSLPDDWKEYPLWALSLPWCALSSNDIHSLSLTSLRGRRGRDSSRLKFATTTNNKTTLRRLQL